MNIEPTAWGTDPDDTSCSKFPAQIRVVAPAGQYRKTVMPPAGRRQQGFVPAGRCAELMLQLQRSVDESASWGGDSSDDETNSSVWSESTGSSDVHVPVKNATTQLNELCQQLGYSNPEWDVTQLAEQSYRSSVHVFEGPHEVLPDECFQGWIPGRSDGRGVLGEPASSKKAARRNAASAWLDRWYERKLAWQRSLESSVAGRSGGTIGYE
jgi:hypothetical protein